MATLVSKRMLETATCLNFWDAADGRARVGDKSKNAKDAGIVGFRLKAATVVDLMNAQSQRSARQCEMLDLLNVNHV